MTWNGIHAPLPSSNDMFLLLVAFWDHRSFVLTQPNVDILPTDLDELTNKHNTELDSGYLSLRLGFTLPSSTYATMLIRQLTLQSTAPAYQKQLEIGDATK